MKREKQICLTGRTGGTGGTSEKEKNSVASVANKGGTEKTLEDIILKIAGMGIEGIEMDGNLYPQIETKLDKMWTCWTFHKKEICANPRILNNFQYDLENTLSAADIKTYQGRLNEVKEEIEKIGYIEMSVHDIYKLIYEDRGYKRLLIDYKNNPDVRFHVIFKRIRKQRQLPYRKIGSVAGIHIPFDRSIPEFYQDIEYNRLTERQKCLIAECLEVKVSDIWIVPCWTQSKVR